MVNDKHVTPLYKKFQAQLHRIQLGFYGTALAMEVSSSILVVIGIVIMLLKLPMQYQSLIDTADFSSFLLYVFNIIIGVELIKMLVRHDLDSVVEVLLFAVARYMIIEHLPIAQTLIGVIAIAILFVVRKYLFISALDKQADEPTDSRDPAYNKKDFVKEI